MKDRVDKSMGIVTLITEDLGNIKPTDPLTLANQTVLRKRNWSDSNAILRSKH